MNGLGFVSTENSGVKKINGVLHTKGGRVISMVCSGKSLYETLNTIYNNIQKHTNISKQIQQNTITYLHGYVPFN